MMSTNKIISIATTLGLYFLLPTSIHAQVVINEVMPDPNSGPEWIELFNSSTELVDINNWTMEDQVSVTSTIWTANDRVIKGGEYLVIELSSAKLNNSGDGVVLKDNFGSVVDQMSYSSTQSDRSWARLPNGSGKFEMNEPSPGSTNPASSLTPSPTPSNSSSPTPTATPNIQLSEVMACPESGQKEWIEIDNQDNHHWQMENWQVVDASGNTKTVSQTINGHSLSTIEWSGSLLNNSGDQVSLVTADDQTLFTVTYADCTKGTSLIFHDGAWRETSTPTKDSSNIFTVSDEQGSDQSPTPSPSSSSTNNSDSRVLGVADDQSDHCSDGSCLSATNSVSETNIKLPTLSTLLESTNKDSNNSEPDSMEPITSFDRYLQDIKYPLLSVILGGVLLMGIGVYHLSQLYEQLQTELDSSPSFPMA